jgi:hypothetical protein
MLLPLNHGVPDRAPHPRKMVHEWVMLFQE